MRGKFVSVEGGEGVGKTTNIEFLQQKLERSGVRFITTREPGGTEIAEQIRTLLLAHNDETLDNTAELLLVFAARAQHLNTLIRPTLEAGTWVLCDRFTDATYAYQGGGRGLNLQHIQLLEQLVQDTLAPDLTILLDIDPRQGLERARKRASLDRFEVESLQFFDRVRAAYLQRAKNEPKRFRIVDASVTLEDVQSQLGRVMSDLLDDYGVANVNKREP